jgi:hypothetical protein
MNRFFNFLADLTEKEYQSKEALIMRLYGPHMDSTQNVSQTRPANSVKTLKEAMIFAPTIIR